MESQGSKKKQKIPIITSDSDDNYCFGWPIKYKKLVELVFWGGIDYDVSFLKVFSLSFTIYLLYFKCVVSLYHVRDHA